MNWTVILVLALFFTMLFNNFVQIMAHLPVCRFCERRHITYIQVFVVSKAKPDRVIAGYLCKKCYKKAGTET